MPFPILAALAGAAANFGAAAFQHRNNKELQTSAYQYGQSADRNHIPNTMAGLKAAGLSPALANGSFGSPASSPGVPSSSAPQMPNFVEAAQLEQNQQLIDAQANLINEQARNVQLVNQRINDEDKTYHKNIVEELKAYASDFSNPERALKAQIMLAKNEIYTKGTADAIAGWNKLVSDNDDRLTKEVANRLQRLILSEQESNGAARALAEMPIHTLRKLCMDIVSAAAAADRDSSAADVNRATLPKIMSEIALNLEQADMKYSENFVKQFKSGDTQAWMANLLGKAVSGVAAGAGFGLGSGASGLAVRGLRQGLSSASQRLSGTSFEKAFGNSVWNGSGFGPKVTKPQKSFDSLNMSEKNRRLLNNY